MLTYAIGDIHGHLDKLQDAHALIAADRLQTGDTLAPVVHVGDLVDRGPDSAGVIGFLLAGRQRGAPWITLLGNHDRMFLNFLAGDPVSGGWEAADWLRPSFGGAATLASYGILRPQERSVQSVRAEALERIPQDHRDFLAGLPLWHRAGEAVFVHAGIRPGLPMEAQAESDLIWIRAPFLHDATDHGALIVHGHTPVDAVTHHGNRLAIDTGAGYGDALSAVAIEGRQAWLLTPAGRMRLGPPAA